MKKFLGLVAIFVVAPALAGAPLDAATARLKAANVLLGNPYGATVADVQKHLVASELLTAGSTSKCSKGAVKAASWEFHVVVADRPAGESGSAADPIDGYLTLDGVTGGMLCAGLPFLD